MQQSVSSGRIVVSVSEREETWSDSSRRYHLSIKVSDSPIERLHPEIIAECGDEHYREELGAEGFELMQELFDTNVVSEMYFMTHTVQVYRKPNASWEEVNAAVLRVLKGRFDDSRQFQVLVLPRKQVLPEHYHPEDSDRPGFIMPA